MTDLKTYFDDIGNYSKAQKDLNYTEFTQRWWKVFMINLKKHALLEHVFRNISVRAYYFQGVAKLFTLLNFKYLKNFRNLLPRSDNEIWSRKSATNYFTILFLVICKPNELKRGTYIPPPKIDSILHRSLKYRTVLNVINLIKFWTKNCLQDCKN